MLTFLCLHGISQTKDNFNNLTLSLKKNCNCEIISLNAPFIFPTKDKLYWNNHIGYELFDTNKETYTWWEDWNEIDKTIEYLKIEFLKINQGIDCVVGFSQGGLIISLLNHLSLKYPEKFEWWKPKCVVLIGCKGINEIKPYCEQKNFHLIGINDTFCSYKDCLSFINEFFKEPVIIKHNRGHTIPISYEVWKPIIEYLLNN